MQMRENDKNVDRNQENKIKKKKQRKNQWDQNVVLWVDQKKQINH